MAQTGRQRHIGGQESFEETMPGEKQSVSRPKASPVARPARKSARGASAALPPKAAARSVEKTDALSSAADWAHAGQPAPPKDARRKTAAAPSRAPAKSALKSSAKARPDLPKAPGPGHEAIARVEAKADVRSPQVEPTAPWDQPTPAAPDAPSPPPHPLPNFEALSRNVARAMEEGGKVAAAWFRPRESGEIKSALSDDVADAITTFGKVAEHYFLDPKTAFDAQSKLSSQFLALWGATLERLRGEPANTAAAAAEPNDKRFADPEWRANPYFDFLRQAYGVTTRWAQELVDNAGDLDEHTRDKARFYLRQLSGALSPSNFIATNPELLRVTMAEDGANLVRGLQMMAEDVAAGKGSLRIRQTDASKFKLGVNMAMSPGKVIYRNDLMELIQYAPSTPDVYKRPLLIVPPWINKFYVLDLNPDKSFIRWAVAQGLTVFIISWVNPDARQAEKGFDAYMREGIFAALDAIEQATGERNVTAIGYCVGGTLLAIALAYMAAVGDKRVSSATFFTTQVDFRDAGDLKIFVDAAQLKQIDEKMAATGYLEGAEMANAFNMLRPNELIWSYFVNNYLKGKEPMPFDLLVWNSDSTRMPAANHSFYLRNCYLENNLTQGRMEIGGKTLNLADVKIPIYDLAAREDHIAPAKSVFTGAQYFGGPVRYVMAGSGHIAGVVNPADKPKYQFWTGGPPVGDFADWVARAKETPGSWWPDWAAWVAAQAPGKVPARQPGEGKLKAIVDAPGDYVRVKA
jgi:polyhydroxyalkanoate synthase subunit PhaC